MHRWQCTVLCMALAAATAWGGDLPTAERARIEHLLRLLSEMKDVAFIRNGKTYDATTAVQFLRRKWEAQAASVTNAASFITQVASQSSTSGKAYELRFSGGAVTNVADVLRMMLEPKD